MARQNTDPQPTWAKNSCAIKSLACATYEEACSKARRYVSFETDTDDPSTEGVAKRRKKEPVFFASAPAMGSGHPRQVRSSSPVTVTADIHVNTEPSAQSSTVQQSHIEPVLSAQLSTGGRSHPGTVRSDIEYTPNQSTSRGTVGNDIEYAPNRSTSRDTVGSEIEYAPNRSTTINRTFAEVFTDSNVSGMSQSSHLSGISLTNPQPSQSDIKVVLKNQATIITQNKEIMINQREILSRLSQIQFPGEQCELPSDLRLPVSTTNELHDLELDLRATNTRKPLTLFLCAIGGNTSDACVRNMMRRLVTDSVAEKCNWIGVPTSKIAFSKFENIRSCVLSAVKRRYAATTEQDVSATMKIWLRNKCKRASTSPITTARRGVITVNPLGEVDLNDL